MKQLSRFTLAKIRLASLPHTDKNLLARLAKSNCHHVLSRVAEHPNTPQDVLEKLADHEHVDVRSGVAQNSMAPLTILIKLSRDHHVDVRYGLAENHNVPPVVLTILAEDDNPYVSCRARSTLARVGIGKTSPASFKPRWTDDRGKRRNHG